MIKIQTMNEVLEESSKVPPVVFGDIGVKFVVDNNGMTNTWHDTLNKPIPDIINEVKARKGWIGGKFQVIYLEFRNKSVGMEYVKYYLDINKEGFNKLLHK